MSQHYPLILDGLVIVLLLATVIYAGILNNRLAGLRDNRAELDRAVRGMIEAANRADAGIKGLKVTADGGGAMLQKKIDKAQGLRDELAFLVGAGEAIASRLEEAANGTSQSSRTPPQAAANGRSEPSLRAVPGTGSKQDGARPARSAEAGWRQPDREILSAIENMR